MAAPQSLKELVSYLAEHPETVVVQQDLAPARRAFEGFRDGKLYWQDEHGRKTFSPLSCHHTGSETALTFNDTGFVIEKFGVRQVFTYAVDRGAQNA